MTCGGKREPRRFLGGWAVPMTKDTGTLDFRNSPGARTGPCAPEPPSGWAGVPCTGSLDGGVGAASALGKGPWCTSCDQGRAYG